MKRCVLSRPTVDVHVEYHKRLVSANMTGLEIFWSKLSNFLIFFLTYQPSFKGKSQSRVLTQTSTLFSSSPASCMLAESSHSVQLCDNTLNQ